MSITEHCDRTGSGERWFEIAPACLAASRIEPHRRAPGEPILRPLRVFALDPAARRGQGAVAVVQIPYEPLIPGPVGCLVEVIDHDTDQDRLYAPADLDDPVALLSQGFEPSLANFRFHQQMVYAVTMKTWHGFRLALGRDPGWGVGAEGQARVRLRIRPHAFREANAYFDCNRGELQLGYYQSGRRVAGRNQPGGWVFTCLSHDIVVHETAHALLHGQRPHFLVPSNPDVLAFHEAFADLVAIFQKFSYPDLVRNAVERSPNNPLIDRLLAGLAEQFGQTTSGVDRPLRTGIEIVEPNRPDNVLTYDATLPPHQLGCVLVSAVFEAFMTVFERKTRRYRHLLERYRPGNAPLDPELETLLAENAARLAEQFLTISIRAIDYCPPVDITFGDYLRALITADRDLVPSDPDGYRDALIDAFARRGIYARGVINLAEDALVWDSPPPELPPITELSFARLQFRGDPGRAPEEDELRRQAAALGRYASRHRSALRLRGPGNQELGRDRVEAPVIASIRSLQRAAPGREVNFELVAEIVQKRHLADAKGGPGFILGGATLVVGSDGHLRYVIHKSLTNQERIAAQREYACGKGRYFWQVEQGRLVYDPAPLRALHALRMLSPNAA